MPTCCGFDISVDLTLYHRINVLFFKGLISQKNFHKQTYLQKRNRVTDVENKLMVIKEESEGEINWEVRIDIYIYKMAFQVVQW